MKNTFLLGTHIYPAKGDSYHRMSEAFLTWRNLSAPLVNLSFLDSPSLNEPLFIESRCLKRDSNTITGCPGIRKPLMKDVFDGLCAVAQDLGCNFFVFSNADIQLAPHFREIIEATTLDSIIFTRLDFNLTPDSPDATIFLDGQDTFAVRTSWWLENRQHFQPYIIGECLWDNVYSAKFARRGRSEIIYTPPVCFHQRHNQLWDPASTFGSFNEFLRLRYDYLDYALWGEYENHRRKLNLQSVDFQQQQQLFWGRLSRKSPSTWLQLKRIVAIALSFAVKWKRR